MGTVIWKVEREEREDTHVVFIFIPKILKLKNKLFINNEKSNVYIYLCVLVYINNSYTDMYVYGLNFNQKDDNCLFYHSISVKRSHDQGNSYRRENLLEGLLTVSDDL